MALCVSEFSDVDRGEHLGLETLIVACGSATRNFKVRVVQGRLSPKRESTRPVHCWPGYASQVTVAWFTTLNFSDCPSHTRSPTIHIGGEVRNRDERVRRFQRSGKLRPRAALTFRNDSAGRRQQWQTVRCGCRGADIQNFRAASRASGQLPQPRYRTKRVRQLNSFPLRRRHARRGSFLDRRHSQLAALQLSPCQSPLTARSQHRCYLSPRVPDRDEHDRLASLQAQESGH